MIKIVKNSYIQFILLGLALLTLPFIAEMGVIRNSTVTVIGTTIIYTIAALGLNVLLGFSGLISLGTAGFMGLAAYISAYVTETMNLPFEVAVLAAIIIPTFLGILVGILSLKFEGIYLGIATLVVAEILREIFINVTEFTGGASGALASRPELLGFFKLDRIQTYYLIVIVMVIIFMLIHNLTKGHMGRALNAMRGSEAAAQAMGINIFKYRLIAFGIATILASVSGVLYVHYVGLSYPTTWNLMLSLDFLAIIVVGGFRSIFGTFIGAFILFAMSELFLKPIPALANIAPLVKGILIIIFILYYPNGLANIKNQVSHWWQRRKGKKDEYGQTKEKKKKLTRAEVRENDTA
ncbi:branched-chain amino acid ABC transporter permease [Alkalibacterium kapii]|uniref:Branched-chain amino acid ABC transporter permease n=1 Tax=Alkalibacterium kapii TaxID=426704 RepID=A0A511AWA6_9LACT|nr:branched-chain amino acid ABC transporter permease [Alkalibacterium kapii]GEK91401.1 branched-chain amino acid ABC transporter permease [Alkalibacterium kapii]